MRATLEFHGVDDDPPDIKVSGWAEEWEEGGGANGLTSSWWGRGSAELLNPLFREYVTLIRGYAINLLFFTFVRGSYSAVGLMSACYDTFEKISHHCESPQVVEFFISR